MEEIVMTALDRCVFVWGGGTCNIVLKARRGTSSLTLIANRYEK